MREKVGSARSLGDMEVKKSFWNWREKAAPWKELVTTAEACPEQAQKLAGSGVKDQLGRPVDLPPRPRELHDGPTGARRQGQSVGDRLAGVGDKVAQDIGPLPFGGRSQLSPVLAGEEEGGIQHHPGVPPAASRSRTCPRFSRTDRAEKGVRKRRSSSALSSGSSGTPRLGA